MAGSTFIALAGRPVHAEAQVDAVRHALDESNNSPVPVAVVPAWVRRLGGITSIGIGGAEKTPPTSAPPEWFGVAAVGISFADRTQIVVPADQRTLGEPDRTR